MFPYIDWPGGSLGHGGSWFCEGAEIQRGLTSNSFNALMDLKLYLGAGLGLNIYTEISIY